MTLVESSTPAAPDASTAPDASAAPTAAATAPPSRRHRRHHAFGFWAATLAFLVNMGFSAVPTPLYVLYQQRDHFSTIMLTVVYAVYAIGVMLSLFLAGHVSDWIGRKRVFVPALLVNAVSALIFIVAPSLPGLLVARVVSGVSVGLTTATATVYLSELHARRPAGAVSPRRAQIVATAANLGGIGVGPLVAGLLAAFAPHPLYLPYFVFLGALLLLAALVALSPETTVAPEPKPRYRPQRVAVPRDERRSFYAATATGLTAFAVYGIFNSLAPSFLAVTLHQDSHAVAGAVPFAAFAAGALVQILLSRIGVAATLRTAPMILIPGLVLLAAGMWVPSLPLFVVGGIVAGAGAALAFRGGLSTAAATAPPESRAEVLATFFLGAYIGLSVPVVILGVATQYVSARSAMLVFSAVVAVAVLGCVRMLRPR
jgi:MFS family permease